jgi:hypothetical protein
MNHDQDEHQSKPEPERSRRHPILEDHSEIRVAYYQSDAEPEEKRSVQIKEAQISALNDANIEGAHRIIWFYQRIQVMTRSTDPKDYAAAVDGALFYSQNLWLKGLKKFNQ